jgi:hypothetical protein
MGRVTARASKELATSPERVLEVLRDYRAGRKPLLPDHFAAGGRERDYRLRVLESDGALVEKDELSSFVCTWRVTPAGAGSAVEVEASWDGAGGIAGAFEGFFAPLGLKRIYGEILGRLSAAVSN